MLLLSALAVADGIPRASAQSGTGQGRRYLFVVETSRAMQRRAQGVHDTLKGLLDSNLNGQMRPGDAIGVWTFNDTISTNFFFAPGWSPTARASLGAQLPNFLEPATYEKRAALDKLIPRLDSLVATSDLLTVILVTTGEEEVQGTPFDSQLRRAFSQWRADQQRTRMPILTLLRGSGGRFSQWSVGAAPWPLEIPSLDVAVQSSKPKTNELPKTSTNQTAPNLLSNKTDPPPARSVGTNQAVAPTNVPPATNLASSAAQTANPALVSGSVTNQVIAANSSVETDKKSAPASNSPSGSIETTKTNVAAFGSEPSGAHSPTPVDPPDRRPAIAFSADAPRREEGLKGVSATAVHEPGSMPAPPPEPSNAQTNNSGSPMPPADSISSAPAANLIPPVENPSAKAPQIAMTPSAPLNFFRENAKWIVGACISGIVAIVCALLWLGTYSRNQLNLATLPKNKKAEH